MRKILFTILGVCALNSITAQNTTNSPTSMFGIGEISTGDGGQFSGMGGVGIALRGNSFLNATNPAALTELDSLKFTVEAGVMGAYKRYHQSASTNSSNVGNINNLGVGFRILPRWYAAASISPVSSVGYRISLDQQVEGTTSTISSYFEGEGGLSRINLSNAFLIGKRFSLGVNLSYVTGTITETETNGTATQTSTSYKKTFYADLGLQYKLPINKNKNIVIGATYGYSQPLTQDNSLSVSSTSGDETIDKSEHTVKQYMPQFFGLGLAYNSLKWTFAADYRYTEWSKMRSSNSIISFANQRSVKAGLAYIIGSPYKNPIRLMLGASIGNSYLIIKDYKATNYYVSSGLGLTLRNKNMLSLGVKYGDQTKVNKGMPHEQSVSFYFNLSFSERTYRGKLQ
ncbi:MAG: putative exported protein [Bacteroidetes bacterium]|nr:putative exported protein [Bacteroidota bacterium]